MTDQNTPSYDGSEQQGDSSNAPAADFGAPAQDNPYAAPADQGQQFSAPADQNPYSAPADQGQQFSAPADQNPYSAPADQGQQFSAPAYGSAPQPGSAPYGDGAPGAPNYGAPAGDQYGQPQYGQGQYDNGQYGAPQYQNGQFQNGQYGAPGQPQYGAPGYVTQMSPQEEVENSKNSHLFSAIGAIFNVGWIVALIFFLINKDKGAFVRQESAASLNFQISIAIYFWASYIIGMFLLIIFVGALLFLVSFAAWLMGFICAFIAANKVGNGGTSNYPLTIKMIK